MIRFKIVSWGNNIASSPVYMVSKTFIHSINIWVLILCQAVFCVLKMQLWQVLLSLCSSGERRMTNSIQSGGKCCKGEQDMVRSRFCARLLYSVLSSVWPKKPVMAILRAVCHVLFPVPSQEAVCYILRLFRREAFFSFKLRSLRMILYDLSLFTLFHIVCSQPSVCSTAFACCGFFSAIWLVIFYDAFLKRFLKINLKFATQQLWTILNYIGDGVYLLKSKTLTGKTQIDVFDTSRTLVSVLLFVMGVTVSYFYITLFWLLTNRAIGKLNDLKRSLDSLQLNQVWKASNKRGNNSRQEQRNVWV